MCFRLYKGLGLTNKLAGKIAKNCSKIPFFCSVGGGIRNLKPENSDFLLIFRDFLNEYVSEPQIFIETNKHPQAGPETPNIMWKKFEHF